MRGPDEPLTARRAQLRQQLEPDRARPRYLNTGPGLGYRSDASGTGP